MIKSDTEMEGAEKLPDKSGKKAQESQKESLVSGVESNTETVPVEDAPQGNDKKTDVEGGYLRKCSVAARDEATEKSVVDAKTHPNSEVVEPMDTSVEPVVEQIKEKSKNADLNQSNTQGEEQIGGDSAIEKQTDATSDLAGDNTNNGGLKEGLSTNNGLESGINVDSVVEKPSADIVDKLPDGSNGVNQNCGEHVTEEIRTMKVNDAGNDHGGEEPLPSEISTNKAAESKSAQPDGILQAEDKGMEVTAANSNEDTSAEDEMKEQGKEIPVLSSVTDRKANMIETTAHLETEEFSHQSQQEPATPKSFVSYSPSKDGDHSGQAVKTVFTQATLPLMPEGDDGTPEEQAAFMKELESFYCGRAMDFKPPKFYGQPLNCLKLWRSVIRLGGYDRVTGSKLWRQVGESFHPPKTCTTVSWTFRIFYEKSLLEFERHKKQCGELQLPLATLPEASGVENEGNGYQGPGSVSGRARRDAAARAMQGWHVQRILDNGEVGEPVIKDKNANSAAKREKNFKSIGSIKQKRPNEVENSIKVARTESFKQLVTSVVDVGPPADWVKINIRQTKDCFEVYALVPGLLREEVRVQSDPAGRLVITGQPEQIDNPWGITPFKKVVTLPARIDPLQTSAVVSLHGRLFVRVPFEQPNM